MKDIAFLAQAAGAKCNHEAGQYTFYWHQLQEFLELYEEKPLQEPIELELESELLYKLMFKAHEQDITLNQLINNILREYLSVHNDK